MRVKDEMRSREGQREWEAIAYRTAARVRVANATLKGRNDPEDHPRARQLLQ